MLCCWALKAKDKPPFTYKCLCCEKNVRTSTSSMSNLSTHCDGYCQQGRMSHVFPKRQEAIAAGAKPPPRLLQENQLTITNKKICPSPSILPKQKSLIMSPWIKFLYCGCCIKQYLGIELKTHIYEHLLATSKQVPTCSSGNGQQNQQGLCTCISKRLWSNT